VTANNSEMIEIFISWT